ncbi:MAG: bifunctional metallophosphatase/5'-nucleotidase [Candidatus Hodarchaeales archaeon]
MKFPLLYRVYRGGTLLLYIVFILVFSFSPIPFSEFLNSWKDWYNPVIDDYSLYLRNLASIYLISMVFLTGIFFFLEFLITPRIIKNYLVENVYQNDSIVLSIGRIWFLLTFIRMIIWSLFDVFVLSCVILFPCWLILERRFNSGENVIGSWGEKINDSLKHLSLSKLIHFSLLILLGLFFLISDYHSLIDLLLFCIFLMLIISFYLTKMKKSESFLLLWFVRIVGIKIFLSIFIIRIPYFGAFSYPVIYYTLLVIILIVNEFLNNDEFLVKIFSSSQISPLSEEAKIAQTVEDHTSPKTRDLEKKVIVPISSKRKVQIKRAFRVSSIIIVIISISFALLYLQNQNENKTLTLLHINDLHGWLQPHEGWGGVATYMGYFRGEGYDPEQFDSSFLLLSGGDQNTGPAIATLSKGQAVIDVMNVMGFDAAAIGNHEFDFGVEWMNKIKVQADFPLLSCNIYNANTTDLPAFTIPWVVQEHAGVKVGIIGLTVVTTSTQAHPRVTGQFDFGDYEPALRRFIPELLEADVDMIIALTHVPPSALTELAESVSDLGIDVFLGGHAGGGTIEYIGDSIVASAEHYAAGYVKIRLSVNPRSNSVTCLSAKLKDNFEDGVSPDFNIQNLVTNWEIQVNASEIISYSSTEIVHTGSNSGIAKLVTMGFLSYYNYTVNLALDGGGYRDYFRQGNITIADVVSVLPFENYLLRFNITGVELSVKLSNGFSGHISSGVRYFNDSWQIQQGSVYGNINSSAIYSGIISDYLWYVSFHNSFPVIDTSVHYRDAVILYFRSLDDIADYT